MRIGFYTNSFFRKRGGIDRIASILSNYFVENGYEVIIFHGKKIKDAPVYPIDSRVKTCEIDLSLDNYELNRSRISALAPDVLVVMSSSDEKNCFISLLKGLDIPLVFSEHSDPKYIKEYLSVEKNREFCFYHADALHFLCDSFLESIPEGLRNKSFVIPNCTYFDEYKPAKVGLTHSSQIILSVSQLQEFPKKISYLIKAFAKIHHKYPDWNCVICATGPDREIYEKLINYYGLAEYVILPGLVDDLEQYYKCSELFCLPSEIEGLPCAMIEAQCYGLPSVGFASCAGVNEIIRHGENGLLADSFTPESLAACLDRLMRDRELRQRMRRRSLELAQRYNKQNVLAQWRTLLEYAAAKKGHTTLDTTDSSVVLPDDGKEKKLRTEYVAQQLRTSFKLAQEVARLERKGA